MLNNINDYYIYDFVNKKISVFIEINVFVNIFFWIIIIHKEQCLLNNRLIKFSKMLNKNIDLRDIFIFLIVTIEIINFSLICENRNFVIFKNNKTYYSHTFVHQKFNLNNCCKIVNDNRRIKKKLKTWTKLITKIHNWKQIWYKKLNLNNISSFNKYVFSKSITNSLLLTFCQWNEFTIFCFFHFCV